MYVINLLGKSSTVGARIAKENFRVLSTSLGQGTALTLLSVLSPQSLTASRGAIRLASLLVSLRIALSGSLHCLGSLLTSLG